jgi:hypothetical protein
LVLTPQAALQVHNQVARVVEAVEQKGMVKKRQSEAGTKQ